MHRNRKKLHFIAMGGVFHTHTLGWRLAESIRARILHLITMSVNVLRLMLWNRMDPNYGV